MVKYSISIYVIQNYLLCPVYELISSETKSLKERLLLVVCLWPHWELLSHELTKNKATLINHFSSLTCFYIRLYPGKFHFPFELQCLNI